MTWNISKILIVIVVIVCIGVALYSIGSEGGGGKRGASYEGNALVGEQLTCISIRCEASHSLYL